MAETAPAQINKSAGHRERRRKSRKSAEDLCLVTVEMEPVGFGLMLDVSETGLGVQVMNRIEPGTDVQIAFKVPELAARIEGSGVITWCDGDGRVGVRFKEIKKDNSKELERWVKSLPDSPIHEPVDAVAPRRTQPILREQVRAIQAQIAASHLDVGLVLQFLVERVVELTHSNGGAIALAQGEEMVCRASTGLAPDVGVAIGSGSALTSECLRSAKIVRCDDTETDPRVDREICRELNLRSSLILPITFGGKVRGVLEVFSPLPKAFNEQHLALLQQLSEFTSQIVYGPMPPSAAEIESSAKLQSKPEHTALSALLSATAKSAEKVNAGESPLPSVVTSPTKPTKADAAAPPIQVSATTKAAPGAAAAAQPARIKAKAEPQALARATVVPVEPPVSVEDLLGVEEEVGQSSTARNIFIVVAIFLVLFGLQWWYRSSSTPTVQPKPTTASIPTAEPLAPSIPAQSSTVAPAPVVPAKKPSSSQQIIAPDVVRSTNPEKAAMVIASGNKPSDTPEAPAAEAPSISIGSANIEGISLPGTAAKPQLEQRPQGVVTGGTLLRRVEPVYPLFAKQQRVQGDLVLSARVTKDGSVDRIKRVSGNPMLEPAAIAAIRQWKYEPYKLNGQPQDVDVSVTLRFRLKP